jgi:predicted PurR-regulated permease PerM
MSTNDSPAAPAAPDKPGQPAAQALLLLKKLAIWGLFGLLLYLARDFFFTAFMTFVFCYLTLALVGWLLRRLSPGRERPGLRRLLTVGVFVLTPLLLLGVGVVLGPRLVEQAERVAGWASHVSPEGEVSRVLEGWVGPSQFKEHYGGPGDPRYQEALEEFRKTGESHVSAYYEFPQLQAWVEAGFSKHYLQAERARLRHQLAREGPSSAAFAEWFRTQKFPALQAQARKEVPEAGRPSGPVDPLVRAAASATPEQLLNQVRHDPAALAALRKEWVDDAVERGVAAAKGSPDYLKQFREYYDKQQASSPATVPYTFDQYVELQKVRPQGRVAFGKALEQMKPAADGDGEARVRADFEAAKKHELFQEWWGSNAAARVIRHQLEGQASGGGEGRMDKVVSSLINVPVDLSTALILSLFICIDFPNLRARIGTLRETWLRDVYEEMAPALHDLTELVGRSMNAQGRIALCNAVLLFGALTLLGVEHAALLGLAVFVLCLVPTLGTMIAWVLIAAVALLQPGGGLLLALKASGAVLGVVLIETFVLSPRILGKMMELHPVLLLSILPLAQYFFGVWGLILATPVAVYVIHVLILRRGLPGAEASRPSPATPAAVKRSAPAVPAAAEEAPVATSAPV